MFLTQLIVFILTAANNGLQPYHYTSGDWCGSSLEFQVCENEAAMILSLSSRFLMHKPDIDDFLAIHVRIKNPVDNTTINSPLGSVILPMRS